MGIRGRLVVFALAFAALAPSLSRAEDRPCYRPPRGLDRELAGAQIAIAYPSAEQFRESEGWTRFAITVTADGAIGDIWLADAIGSDGFGKVAAAALAKAKYNPPPMIGGKPARLGGAFEASFRLHPLKRGGVHSYYSEIYARGEMARERGDFAGAVRILKTSLPWPLDLYEMANISYALAVSYQGLNDWRRALRHISHATIDEGMYVDKGWSAAALAIAVELYARDHNHHWASCTYETYKREHPSAADSAQLTAAMTEAQAALAATAPIRTDVEILEQDRADLTPHWWHPLLRPSFAVENVQGAVTSYRLDCVGHIARGSVVSGARVSVPPPAPPSGECELYVMGEPGAKFVLDER